MVGALQPPQTLVAPVCGKRVLDEVVRADGEEGRLRGEVRRADRRRWRLDHHPRLDFPELYPFSFQLGTSLVQHPFRGTQLPRFDDHGEHDLEVAVDRRAQESAQLGLEEVGRVEAHPYAPPAEEGVVFVDLIYTGQVLVPPHVERTDDDGFLAEGADDG